MKTLSRPGTNATGFTVMEPTTRGKWMELLKEIAPQNKARRAAFQSENRTVCRLLAASVQRRGELPRRGAGCRQGRKRVRS